MSISETILLIGGISGALLSIWALISKVINPVKKMLTEYRDALCDAQKQIAEISVLNIKQNEQIEISMADAQRIKSTIKDILSFILMTECTEVLTSRVRTLGKTKDLDRIHTRYTQYGLNGAGQDLWERFLGVPLEEEKINRQDEQRRINRIEQEYKQDFHNMEEKA